MREIKFRVWSPESKKMYLPKKGCDFLVRIDGEYFVDEDIVENVGLISVKREDYILMQYTGLKDGQGKEIYEGDIVTLGDNMTADDSMGILPNGWNYSKEEDVYAVVWDEELAGWDLDWREERFEDVEKEFGVYKEAYIRKYKGHSRGILLDENGTVEVIGNIYENPDLLKEEK